MEYVCASVCLCLSVLVPVTPKKDLPFREKKKCKQKTMTKTLLRPIFSKPVFAGVIFIDWKTNSLLSDLLVNMNDLPIGIDGECEYKKEWDWMRCYIPVILALVGAKAGELLQVQGHL